MSKEQNTQLAKNKSSADMYLPTTSSEAYKIATSFSKSAFCPAQYRGKPDDVYLAMAYGAQIGLNPLLAVQNIAVINGKPSVYGDALTAIAQGHHETEQYEDGYLDNGTAFCKITRKGRTIYREFSKDMAIRAGLWGQNTWKKYPERMLLWRARGWAIRDAFADVLMGLWSVEEAVDGDVVTPDRIVSSEADTKPSAPSAKSSTKAGSIKDRIKKQAAPETPETVEPVEENLEVQPGDLTPPEEIPEEELIHEIDPPPLTEDDVPEDDSWFYGEDA